ncbi:MAG: AraC family transcriptional regulator [Burkholderiales bacterium]|jgi:AraC family transcriptional regulator|nr:AraC family transcriptional regulator [Burkholderiales bacterium]
MARPRGSPSDPERSALPWADAHDGRRRDDVLAHAQVLASSRTFGWDGLYVEVGENTRWQVENLVPVGHYVAISRATDDFTFRVCEAGVWRTVTMPPGSLWVQPAKQPFSFDVTTTARWGGAILDPVRLRALLGVDAAIEPVIGLDDPVLGPLMQALVAEVLRGGTSGRRFGDAMLLALGAQLLRLFGEARAIPRGGLTGRTLTRIGDWIDAHVAEPISVAALAGIAGLSEAHFARAFKQTTGVAPHRFLMDRRLERGKRMLADTELPIAAVAAACGFADQAHFTRQFTRTFGATPGVLRGRYRPD